MLVIAIAGRRLFPYIEAVCREFVRLLRPIAGSAVAEQPLREITTGRETRPDATFRSGFEWVGRPVSLVPPSSIHSLSVPRSLVLRVSFGCCPIRQPFPHPIGIPQSAMGAPITFRPFVATIRHSPALFYDPVPFRRAVVSLQPLSRLRVTGIVTVPLLSTPSAPLELVRLTDPFRSSARLIRAVRNPPQIVLAESECFTPGHVVVQQFSAGGRAAPHGVMWHGTARRLRLWRAGFVSGAAVSGPSIRPAAGGRITGDPDSHDRIRAAARWNRHRSAVGLS